MKILSTLLLFAALAVSALAQSTLVVTSTNYPSYPVGLTNVPLSMDTSGRLIISPGSGVAVNLPAAARAPRTMIAARPAPPPVSTFRLLLSIILP